MSSKPIWQSRSSTQNSKLQKQKFRKIWQQFTTQQMDSSIAWHIRNWNLSGCLDDLLD